MSVAVEPLIGSTQDHSRSFLVAGIPCAVTANAAMLECVDEAYGAYGADLDGLNAYSLQARPAGDGFVVTDSEGCAIDCRDGTAAVFAVLERIVRHVTERLAEQGIYTVHAGSLVHEGEALIIPGSSRAGKTTLTLALVRRGLGMLSDEFALSAPDARTIYPYRRGLHVRPGTPELIGELGFLRDRPFHPLGGGFQWTLSARELERAFPSCFANPAPLRHIVLLDASRGAERGSVLEPVPGGVVAMELVRATTAAADDLTGAIRRMTQLVEGTRCVRLRPGRLESSVELLLDWLDRRDD
jgi:hypothetical protein